MSRPSSPSNRRLRASRGAVALTLLASVLACRTANPPAEVAPTSSKSVPPLDVTFVVSGDIHVGDKDRGMTPTKARNHVLALNTFSNPNSPLRLKWPKGTASEGQYMSDPEVVFVPGDLAVDGSLRIPDEDPAKLFRQLYTGYGGVPPLLRLPVALGAGNHDWPQHDGWFSQYASERARAVRTFAWEAMPRRVSTFDPKLGINGSAPPHYAITLGNGSLLAVHLNTSLAEPCRRATLDNFRWTAGVYVDPNQADCPAYQWLKDTLAAHARQWGMKAPIVIIQHYGYDEASTKMEGYRGYWWHPDERQDLADILKDYNVLGIFHGHGHNWGVLEPGVVQPPSPVFVNDEITSSELNTGFSAGRAWVDVNLDGKADFCRVIEKEGQNGRVACRLATASGLGSTDWTSGLIDTGDAAGRSWVDANGDKRPDFCRVNSAKGVSCLFTTDKGFGDEVTSAGIDPGWADSRAFVDVNGDGTRDYCRLVGTATKATCLLLVVKDGVWRFDSSQDISSVGIDGGFTWGRGWVDLDGDGCTDYCRVVRSAGAPDVVRCLMSRIGKQCGNRGGFWDDTSFPIEVGRDYSRTWVDVNGDGKADYCRSVNWDLGNSRLMCNFGPKLEVAGAVPPEDANGTGPDIGDPKGRTWADFDGNKSLDYCRVVSPDTGRSRVSCMTTTSSATTVAGVTDFMSRDVDPGDPASRAWPDVNGDGRADFCRVIGASEGSGRVRCTLSGTKGTTVPYRDISSPSGYCQEDKFDAGFVVARVANGRLDIAAVEKDINGCKAEDYAGKTTTCWSSEGGKCDTGTYARSYEIVMP